MASIDNQDRFFSGQQSSSAPKYLIPEGTVARLINGRFVEGAISNAIGFDEFQITYTGKNTYVPNANVTYQELLEWGDVQDGIPLKNIAGKFWILVISGVMFLVDLDTNSAYDITPVDAFLTTRSRTAFPVSHIDNTGGVYGVGGYAVIFNYPNRPIFVGHLGSRISAESNYEMPASRFGATAASRAIVVSGDNLFYVSDPLGGAESLAPLTFNETLEPGSDYLGQIFTIGSALESDVITAVARMPGLLGPTQEFLARNVLISTKRKKYIVAVGQPRANWQNSQFITHLGSIEGIAGPLAWTNIGSAVVYIATTGRIKQLSQDTSRESSLSEEYFDDALGQYLCCQENHFHYRKWYRMLDHSHSQIKFNKDRLYATVYPFFAPSLSKYGETQSGFSHRALAVGSLDPETLVGPQASIAWEGFYDWLHPAVISVIEDTMYVVSKGTDGKNLFYKENFLRSDTHPTTIFTRGYFSESGKSRSLTGGSLFFRQLSGPVKIRVSYWANRKWVCASEAVAEAQVHHFRVKEPVKSNDASLPLKIEIEHLGCQFELQSAAFDGEVHREQKR